LLSRFRQPALKLSGWISPRRATAAYSPLICGVAVFVA
jgi:hypothetical protein